MDNQTRIFFDKSPEEREKLLEALAVRKERTTFNRSLSDEELQSTSASYIRGQIDLARMVEDKKAAVDEWKTKIDAKEKDLETQLEEINKGQKQVTGVLYFVRDFADNVMRLYDKNGELIEKRPLGPEDRQTRAFIEGPSGTMANPDEGAIEDIHHEDVTVEEQIDKMYEGPKLADLSADNMTEEEAKALNSVHDIQEEQLEPNDQVRPAGEAGGMENGMAWDDPRQVRVQGSEADKAAEEGAKGKRKRTPIEKKTKSKE